MSVGEGPVRELRIHRVVVEAPPGTDRARLARELAQSLPQAIGERLAGRAAAATGEPALARRVADAVAERLPGAVR